MWLVLSWHRLGGVSVRGSRYNGGIFLTPVYVVFLFDVDFFLIFSLTLHLDAIRTMVNFDGFQRERNTRSKTTFCNG